MMLYGVAFKEGGGDLLDKTRRHMLEFFMSLKLNIIIDNTNLHPKQEVYYREVVEMYNIQNIGKENYEFSIKDFTGISVAVCLKQNAGRQNPVPEKVIMGMYNSYLKKEAPTLAQDETLPKAIVVDLDGTMAHIDHRSPYDIAKVYEDTVNQPIRDLVEIMLKSGHHIIFMSGRDESARKDTVRWLTDKAKLDPKDYDLYLRPDNDQRPDTKYKQDVFHESVEGHYFIDFWIEDRWRMTNAVRNELGITCLQCADGHF